MYNLIKYSILKILFQHNIFFPNICLREVYVFFREWKCMVKIILRKMDFKYTLFSESHNFTIIQN